MRKFIRNIMRDQRGATAIEYGLILGAMAISMAFGLKSISNAYNAVWQKVGDSVSSDVNRP